jgi:hypothetical protein
MRVEKYYCDICSGPLKEIKREFDVQLLTDEKNNHFKSENLLYEHICDDCASYLLHGLFNIMIQKSPKSYGCQAIETLLQKEKTNG